MIMMVDGRPKTGTWSRSKAKGARENAEKLPNRKKIVIDFSSKSFISSELGKKGIRGEQRLFIFKPLKRINWRVDRRLEFYFLRRAEFRAKNNSPRST